MEINTARSTAEVVRVAARHALRLAEAGRVRVTATGARHEEDAGGDLPVEPTVVLPLTGTAGEQLGELRVWRREGGGTEEAALGASEALLEAGLLVVAVRPPTVPRGTSRLRVTLSSEHTDDEVDRLCDAIHKLNRKAPGEPGAG